MHGLLTKILRIMRLSAILLLVSCLHVSAKSYSQSVTFSGKNVPLQQVLAIIEKQTGYVCFHNGNVLDAAAPVTISVDSPADKVRAIAIFTERNPQTEVAVFTLGPRAGKAEVSTRIRLATSQRLMAVARMSDGSYWSHGVDVIVALAACIEGEAP